MPITKGTLKDLQEAQLAYVSLYKHFAVIPSPVVGGNVVLTSGLPFFQDKDVCAPLGEIFKKLELDKHVKNIEHWKQGGTGWPFSEDTKTDSYRSLFREYGFVDFSVVIVSACYDSWGYTQGSRRPFSLRFRGFFTLSLARFQHVCWNWYEISAKQADGRSFPLHPLRFLECFGKSLLIPRHVAYLPTRTILLKGMSQILS